MASHCYFVILSILLLVWTPQHISSETIITIESPEDFSSYGFECFEGEVDSTSCQLNWVTSPHQLPPSFPASYHSLTGSNFLFATSTNDSITDIGLVTNGGIPVNYGDYMMITAEYYTETVYSIGYSIWGDAGLGFFDPASNSTWKLDHTKYVIKAADTMLMISLAGNKDRFAVFRKLTFIINPDPIIDVEIKEPADFDRYGIPCPECTIGSVNSSQDLPPVYPDSFRNLNLDSSESLMFVVPNEWDGRYELILVDLSNATNLTCAGYVDLTGEYYIEQISIFGYGLTYGTWSPLAVSSGSSWTAVDRTSFDMRNYLRQGNRRIGFYSEAEGRSVFKRLRVQAYWYPAAEMNCNFMPGVDAESQSLATMKDDHPLAHLLAVMKEK